MLLGLYITVAAVLIFRIQAEATGYISPDSAKYLELAQNLKDGKGLYLYDGESGRRIFFSTWPVGYPVLIYVVSAVSTLSVFWASKVLNLLLLGLSFLVLRQINRKYAFILASVYCSYTLLEVYSFTWSEAPFLLGLLYLCYLSDKILTQEYATKSILFLFLTCFSLFLLRYIGAFSFSAPTLLAFYLYYKKRNAPALKLLAVSTILGMLAALYLYMNYLLSGFTTGFDRMAAGTEPMGAFVSMMTEGLLNELLLIRKYRAGNQPDYLLYIATLLQLITVAVIITKVKKPFHLKEQTKRNIFSLTCLITAALYFLSILLLRSISHFDDLDYRLLAPFSFLFWIGLVHVLCSLPDTSKSVVQAKYMAFAFFLISLLLNLPKQYILGQLKHLLQ
ncbi:hypothetical protein GCM10023188_26920 [Pontibacter saemangeumensis]|uniref:Glycosyltransferase RgtA/B/C/D-like domain-containing protein n=1 Tax=Pontibacter saemangeumensis TaxID=1084525 RepID=A0ABP8LTF3_9BACT